MNRLNVIILYYSCIGMLHYGVLVGNNTLAFLNVVGAVLQVVYISVFLLCATSKVSQWKVYLNLFYSKIRILLL